MTSDLTENPCEITPKRQPAEVIFGRLLSNNPNPVLCADSNGIIVYANESSLPVTAGYNGRIPESLFPALQAAQNSGKRQCREVTFGTRKFWFDIVPDSAYDLVILYGTEEPGDRRPEQASTRMELDGPKKEMPPLQTLSFHTQKLEAVGTLASGIAHDFNNLLTTINAYVDICMSKASATDQIAYFLKRIHSASKKASGIVRQLLLFSRKEPMSIVEINCNEIINNLLKMLCRQIEESITIETEFDPGLWAIMGDEGMIEQVVMNLAINGRDAMPAGGRLVIKTANVMIDENRSKAISEARPGKFVSLTVVDTGSGIDDSLLPRIFEPFFTTKPESKGAGLGLSVVYGIVRQHHGWIEVESELDIGSSFTAFFPAFSDEPKGKMVPDLTKPDEKLLGKGERILFVEYDREVREMSAELLRQCNYHVFTAKNAKRAWELFQRENGRIDLVFCDMMLPDMPGVRLVEELHSSRSGFSVIFCTGYEELQPATLAKVEEKCLFLRKPYPLTALLETIKEALRK